MLAMGEARRRLRTDIRGTQGFESSRLNIEFSGEFRAAKAAGTR
jgi:hypothetical protein